MPHILNWVRTARIQNATSVAIEKNRSNAKIASHIAVKMRFGQLKNLSNAAVSLWIYHILNPWLGVVCHSVQYLHLHLAFNSNGDEGWC